MISSIAHYLNPEFLISTLGLIGIYAIVFAESGLFFGFFLPGDSLLFTAGLFASQGVFGIIPLVLGIFIAAVLGDTVGYMFGRKVGPALFSREDSFFFSKNHAHKASEFYEKHGKKAIILARFIPVIRTFAPIVAGIGKMKYKTFMAYNVIGGAIWTGLLTLSGYFLGKIIPGIGTYLNYIIVVIIFISIIPIVFEWVRSRKNDKQKKIII